MANTQVLNDKIVTKLDLKSIVILVSMLGMLMGLAGQWYTQQNAVTNLQDKVIDIKKEFTEYKAKNDERVEKNKLDVNSTTINFNTIKQDVQEIKNDVKSLLQRSARNASKQ